MTNFLQLFFAGLALGSRYALVALGFVIIFKATGVINFAQGAMVTLGGYFAFNFHRTGACRSSCRSCWPSWPARWWAC